jgi:V/A-type H+-transporting ATPase subunit I
METVFTDKIQSWVFVVYYAECEEQVQQILKTYGFSRIQFKEMAGNAAENITVTESRIREIEIERKGIEEAIIALTPEKRKFQVLYDYLQIRSERSRIASRFGKSDRVFMLEGWLPAELTEKFMSVMEDEFTCYIEIKEAEKGEEHPILLKNPALIRVFEPITEMYSLPSVNDVDPNPVMAPFYFLLFGMMIGDFGYGLILTIAMLVLLKKFKPQGMSGKMIAMLALGGISTAFWGLVFGSHFGDLPQAFLSWVTGNPEYKKAFYGLWFNPLSDPMKLLMFSMALGGCHLFAGLGIKMYMLFRDGKVFEAIFDVGSWFVLLIGVVFVMIGVGTGVYMAAVGAAMLIFTQGRESKNPIAKLFNGIMSLYGITGYLGDVLSYSRLLALGLATGVVGSVINTLATLSSPGIVSTITFVLIIIVGTAFNLAINALGAFVHSSRLQYVEFFGKFYKGGGESFKPFKISTKYIKIIGGKVL